MNYPENIVELYRRHCYNPNEMREEGEETSKVVVVGKKFTRTVFRPDNGPDILICQAVQNGRTFFYNLELPVIQSSEAFSRFISNSESAQQELNSVTPQRQVHDSLLNQWTWDRVTANIFRYVNSRIDFRTLEARDRFACKFDEAFGELCIMREEAYNIGHVITPFMEMRIGDRCPLCPRNYRMDYAFVHDHDEDQYAHYLRFLCCDLVFHKRCILPWLWKRPLHFSASSSCPVCLQR